MEELLKVTAMSFLPGNSLQAFERLLENPDFARSFRYLVRLNSELARSNSEVHPMVLASLKRKCEDYAERAPLEPSVVQSLRKCGDICKPYIEELLLMYRNSREESSKPHRKYVCPFYESDGIYYVASDTPEPISNSWAITEVSLWVYPLPSSKQRQYKVLAPIALHIEAFWAGVSKVEIGDLGYLLPPYHPFLVIKLEFFESVRWLAYDCGEEGIGLASHSPTTRTLYPPLKELLGKNSTDVIPIRRFVPKDWGQKRASEKQYWAMPMEFTLPKITLYDLLAYGVANSAPVSVKWHLENYKDVISAVSSYFATTCWSFVNGALELFTRFRLTPVELKMSIRANESP